MDEHWHSVFDNSMRLPWLYFCYWFDMSVLNSLMLSIPYVSCHSVFSDDVKVYRTHFSWTIYGWVVTQCFWEFHASPMTLFLLSNSCVSREFSYAVDSIRNLSLSIQWRFEGLQWLCFRWRFMDQPWYSFFDHSMHQPWLYFGYRFHTLDGTQFSMMISRSTAMTRSKSWCLIPSAWVSQ
jgi:hypothetical protein